MCIDLLHGAGGVLPLPKTLPYTEKESLTAFRKPEYALQRGKKLSKNGKDIMRTMAESSSRQPLTMSQIAAAAGVSVPTVSKVINQRADVAPATRERVQRVMEEYGYVL